MLSHEFRSPLTSTLMLLETLLDSVVLDSARQVILLVISQINLLLCLVNDILDLKMIQQNRFVTRLQEFNPLETFKFVIDIFRQHAEVQSTALSFEVV